MGRARLYNQIKFIIFFCSKFIILLHFSTLFFLPLLPLFKSVEFTQKGCVYLHVVNFSTYFFFIICCVCKKHRWLASYQSGSAG